MDFTLTAYFAEILYSSLTKYRPDGYYDTAALLFMFLFFSKIDCNSNLVCFPIYYNMSYFNVFLSVNLFSEVLVEESLFFFFFSVMSVFHYVYL